MADALDSGSSGSDTVWVQVPSTAGVIEKAGHKTCLFYYVAEPNLNPRVQGLLDMNVSSVGSTGKRSTGPFSVSVSPHLPHWGESLEYFKNKVFRAFFFWKISAIFRFTLFVFCVRYEVIFLLAEGVAFFKIQVECYQQNRDGSLQ